MRVSLALHQATDFGLANIDVVAYWRAEILLHIYTLFDETQEGLSFTLDDNAEIASFTTMLCPNRILDGIWESIYVDKKIKDVLSMLAHSAMLFSIKGVDSRLITGNKVRLDGKSVLAIAERLITGNKVRLDGKVY